MNARAGQARSSSSGSDPLAELARLIGQNDPFGEYARENARRAAPAEPPAQTSWSPPQPTSYPQAVAHETGTQSYDAQGYEQQSYGQQGYHYQQAGSDAYAAADGQIPSYLQRGPAQAGHDAQYEHAAYDREHTPYSAEQQDFYDDVPPSRRRIGIVAIAGVLALAVVGTAGAFGYRAIFGSSGSGGQPPVIKADTAPSKVVPAGAKDAGSSKLITDRVGSSSGERLVSREERPVDKPVMVMRDTPPQAGNVGTPPGTGVIGSEPKKIRTIAIHPDGSAAVADASQTSIPATEPPPRPAPVPPQRTASAPSPEPARAAAPPRAAPHTAAAPANAPLSLNPNAPAPRAASPQRTASAPAAEPAPTASHGNGSGTYVQVSSQKSEAEAQAAFRSLQGKYPSQLGSRQPAIRRVDLGDKGVYYRAMVGPLASSEASELCSSLKAAGGQCLIQRN